MLNILHVYRTYFPDPPGGLQEAIRQISISTLSRDVNVHIFTLSPIPNPGIIKRPEATVYRNRSWLSPSSCDIGGIESFRSFRAVARMADLIHYHFPWPFADVLHLSMRHKVPAIITYHSDIVRQRFMGVVYNPLMRRMLGSMSRIVATSPSYAVTSPVLSNPAFRDRVRVIPLGIDETSYPQPCEPSILSRFGLVDGESFFLFIGVLRYYKGLHTLIQAAAAVNSRVVIAGSGPEDEALRVQAKRLNLSNVTFAGQVTDDEKVSLLKNCRAFVLPSHMRSEAFGMVLVEASMFGKPLITCEIGTGTSYVNADRITGLVVPPEDSEALARAMNVLIADDDLCRQFGVAARQRYEQLFSGEALGRSYAALYREVLENK